MRKSVLMAKRDYLATVLTKGFVIGLFAPVLLGLFMTGMMQTSRVKLVAVIDHTGLGVDSDLIQMEMMTEETKKRNPALAAMPSSGLKFETALEGDRAALIGRIRKGDLYGVLDVESLSRVVLHSSSGMSGMSFMELTQAVDAGVRRAKLAQSGIPAARFVEVLTPVAVEVQGLDQKGAGLKQNLIQSMLIPSALMVLMGLVVLTGSTGMLGAVAEDKKERVFEMMLGSATPLDIIVGKVMGSVGVSLTMGLAWLVGAGVALYATGLMGVAPVELLPWVCVYLICQATMLSALGAALGAAASAPREAQQFAVLLVFPTMLPFMLLVPLLDQPNSWWATAMSLFPPFTPMVMMMRQAMPGGWRGGSRGLVWWGW